jgi:hypothetical protein
MAALTALTRANTDAAISALQKLAQQAADPGVRKRASDFVANRPPVMTKASR